MLLHGRCSVEPMLELVLVRVHIVVVYVRCWIGMVRRWVLLLVVDDEIMGVELVPVLGSLLQLLVVVVVVRIWLLCVVGVLVV